MGEQYRQSRRPPDNIRSRPTSASTEQIIEEARKLIGAKFKANGRELRLGVDCVGVLVLAGRACGLDIDDHTYADKPSQSALEEGLALVATRDSQVNLAPGRIAQMAVGMREAIHVGIVARIRTWPTIIHAWQSQQFVYETIIDAGWDKRIIATWKLNNVY